MTAFVVGPLPSGEFAVRDSAGTFGLYPKAPGPRPELHAARYCAALNGVDRVQVFSADGWEKAALSHVLEVPPSWATPVPLRFRITLEMHTEVQKRETPP